MHPRLHSVLLRGLLATVLSVVAVAAAATQAVRFEGEVRLDAGRLVLVEQSAADAQCATSARTMPFMLARNPG